MPPRYFKYRGLLVADNSIKGRVNPFTLGKIAWITENDDFKISDIVRIGARLFIEDYEKTRGITVPVIEKENKRG